MLKKLLMFALMVLSVVSYGQDKTINPSESKSVHDDNVYNSGSVEVKPSFPGGMKEFYAFVSKNFKPPENTTSSDLKLKIYLSFVIDVDGSLTAIKLLHDPGYGAGQEAVRVLGLSPKWSPGKDKGRVIKTSLNLPITINIPAEELAPEPKMTAVERNVLNDNVAVPDFKEKDLKADENKIYIMPYLDEKPTFPGGNDKILVFFNNNFDTKILKANAWIFVDFIIEKDGSTSIRVNKSTGADVEAEAKRVFSKMPKFSPGKIGGQPVRSTFSQRFNITKG